MPARSYKNGVILLGVLFLVGVLVLVAPRLLNQPVKGIPRGWSAIAGSVDDWTWRDGKIRGHVAEGQSMLVSSKVYTDVTLSANATSTNREASFVIRARDADNCYLVIFVPSNTPWMKNTGWIELVKRQGGKDKTLAKYQGRIMTTLGHTAKIATVAKGTWIEVLLNDVSIIRVQDTTYTSGFIGIRMFGRGPQSCDATYSFLRFN